MPEISASVRRMWDDDAASRKLGMELHEAVEVVETDQAPDRTVVDLARSGWRMGDRVLRPAEVIVSRRPDSAA